MSLDFHTPRVRFRASLLVACSLSALSLDVHAQAPPPAPADSKEVGVAIKPSVYNFTNSKGETAVQTVTVVNSQPTAAQVRFYVGDWVRDSNGQHIYYPSGTIPYSCANWVKLSRDFMEVPPNSVASFDMTLSVPESDDSVKTMRWAMLFVEGANETKETHAKDKEVLTTIVKKQRIGLHIYETPPNVTSKEMKLLAFKSVPGKNNSYRMTIQNTGLLQIKCKPYLELTALNEAGTTNKIEIGEVPLFPEQIRVVTINIPEGQPKGKYNVIAGVDGGEDIPIEATQAEIDVL